MGVFLVARAQLVRVIFCFLAVSILSATALRAQSLTDQLKQADPETLAREAREKGDPVKGAVLFASPSLGCASCHASGSNTLVGPDLSQLPKDRTDLSLIESLLEPSRTIREGYETTLLETTDGNALALRVTEENETVVIGYETVAPFRKVTVRLEDVLAREKSPVSSMPEGLPDRLKSQQEFLDVLSYLIQLRDAERTETAEFNHEPTRRELSTSIQGLVLLDRFNCRACHSIDQWEQSITGVIAPYQPPRLDRVGSRWDLEHLQNYLLAPADVKPGSRMPHLLDSLPQQERAEAALELSQYLRSLDASPEEPNAIDPEQVPQGYELFHQVGCAACHAPRDEAAHELAITDAIPLGDLSQRYRVDALTAFLEKPHDVRPSGRMPDLRLDHFEALALSHYLLQNQTTGNDVAKAIAPEIAARGAERFIELRCNACHSVDQSDATSEVANQPLIAIEQTEQGCLSGEAGPWPHFSMSSSERELMRETLSQELPAMVASQRVELAMASLGCYACHTRDGVGGVSLERDAYFQTADFNLGPQGRIPPNLTGVGAKLKPEWLRQVLVSGRSIRPYLLTRMPRFGIEHGEAMASLISLTDDKPDRQYPEVADAQESRKAGHELAGNTGLNCIACHTYQFNRSETMSAVDLTEMYERLQRDWFEDYLRSPQSLSPNTVMPSFWPGGRAIRPEILEGDTDRQIEALWVYLEEGRQASEPRGLRNEPLALLATDEAVMLRRSYHEVGKRGIGVGYPGQVNLVFDAEQIRLAMLWRGDFADPSGVWRSQGHGNVSPLSREVIKLVTGPELDWVDDPWTVEDDRPLGYHFKGYRLDAERRPEFRYQVEGLLVRDFPREQMDGEQIVGLSRTLTFEGELAESPMAFRLSRSARIELTANREYTIDGRLKITVPEGLEVELIEAGELLELRFLLDASILNRPVTLQYTW